MAKFTIDVNRFPIVSMTIPDAFTSQEADAFLRDIATTLFAPGRPSVNIIDGRVSMMSDAALREKFGMFLRNNQDVVNRVTLAEAETWAAERVTSRGVAA